MKRVDLLLDLVHLALHFSISVFFPCRCVELYDAVLLVEVVQIFFLSTGKRLNSFSRQSAATGHITFGRRQSIIRRLQPRNNIGQFFQLCDIYRSATVVCGLLHCSAELREGIVGKLQKNLLICLRILRAILDPLDISVENILSIDISSFQRLSKVNDRLIFEEVLLSGVIIVYESLIKLNLLLNVVEDILG